MIDILLTLIRAKAYREGVEMGRKLEAQKHHRKHLKGRGKAMIREMEEEVFKPSHEMVYGYEY